MKKLFTIAFFLCSMLQVLGQVDILNGGFEDTTIVSIDSNTKDTLINHWHGTNFGAGVTSDAYSGDLAAYVWNWYYYVPGRLTNGNLDTPTIASGGTPITFRPSALTGFYKYIEGEAETQMDSGLAEVWLFKYNSVTSSRDTLGYGIEKLPLTNSYTNFVVDINYTSSQMPDTVLVQFSSSEQGFCTFPDCLFLYLDDIALTTSTGVSEKVVLHSKPIIYPNPSEGQLFVDMKAVDNGNYFIYSSLGKLVKAGQLKNGEVTELNINSLPSGIYTIKSGNYSAIFIRK